ncbi:hypothetical protein CLV46_0216 [Diaminobutyricimonas aerilata]|uniref:Uncharacterized protein n=1 Tax=Diaminobutyricimonas aerilata TaxID=1162967 RepID=A0A2M9CFH3_9MICO|nr:hypothetical protein [Diaminobutyricimonas aerilata]PJJ70694.1 hypothetical protein CLV46_0216 [Diaminobutyricimonas aerilata]
MTDPNTNRDEHASTGAHRADDATTTSDELDAELTPSDTDDPVGDESSWEPGAGRPSPSVGGGAQDVRPDA